MSVFHRHVARTLAIGWGAFSLGLFAQNLQVFVEALSEQTSASPGPPRDSMRISLADGGRVRGRVEGMENGQLRFQPLWSGNATLIPWESILEMISPAWDGAGASPSPARVSLTNGDQLSGAPKGFDNHRLKWETRTGAVLRLDKDAIKDLEFFPPPEKTLDHGVLPVDRWESISFRGTEETLTPVGGGLVFYPARNLSIGRQLPSVSKPFALEFRLETESESYGYGFLVFGDNPRQLPLGGLTFTTGTQHINAQYRANRPEDISRWMGETGMKPGEPHHYQFFVDPVGRKKMWLFLNGRKMNAWELRQDFSGENLPMFCIRVHQLLRPMRLTEYRVYAWNGQLPAESPLKPEDDRDQLLLRDGTLHAGRWISSPVGTIRFSLEDREVMVPMEKVLRILPAARPEVETENGVLIRFHNTNDRVTLNDVRLDEEGVEGKHSAWEGELRLSWREVSLLRRGEAP